MGLPRRFDQPHPSGAPARLPLLGFDTLPARPLPPLTPRRIDWKTWLRAMERKRRLLARRCGRPGRDGPDPRANHPADHADAADAGDPPQRLDLPGRRYLALVTRVSFEMDGIATAGHELDDALAPGAARRPFLSRQAQRLRNHVAILHRIGMLSARGQPLEARLVVRWYTSISCGLSSARLDGPSLERVAGVVRRINSPHLNLRPALEESAGLYLDLLADPIVPSFNGILARLLLACQLARCGLPPVLFDPRRDPSRPASAASLLPRLLEMIQESYDALLSACRASPPARG